MYEHAADVYNNLEYEGRSAPVPCAGTTADVTGDDFHVFGAKCAKFVAPERRNGKLDMPALILIWAGRSDRIAHGHKVFEAEWNDRTKSFDFGQTEHAADVLVFDDTFPLKMMPRLNGSVDDFETIVDRFDVRSTPDNTYQVEAITDHRWAKGARRGKKQRPQLEFLVRWKGCMVQSKLHVGAAQPPE